MNEVKMEEQPEEEKLANLLAEGNDSVLLCCWNVELRPQKIISSPSTTVRANGKIQLLSRPKCSSQTRQVIF